MEWPIPLDTYTLYSIPLRKEKSAEGQPHDLKWEFLTIVFCTSSVNPAGSGIGEED